MFINKLMKRDEPAPLPEIIPPRRETLAQSVTPQEALGLPEVFRSVSIITTIVSSLSLDIRRGNATLAQPSWFSRPDMRLSSSRWLGELTVSLALRGNAYLQVIRTSPTESIQALIVLDPRHCIPNDDGTLSYNGKRLQRWQFKHLKLLPIPGVLEGLGPIQASNAALSAAIQDGSYRNTFRDTSGVPSGILKTDQQLSQEQASQYKETWDSAPAGSTRVLGQGLSYQGVLLTPQEVQFIEGSKFTAQQIARLFGIPAHYLNVSQGNGSMTYQNVQDAMSDFIRVTLSQYTREIEEALSDLLPRGQEARFNFDGLLRANTVQRYTAHQIALTSGFLTKDEVREIEGLEPLPITATQEEQPNEND